MPSGPAPRIDLRTLILSFALLSTLATLLNDFYATYRIERQTLVHTSLEANRAYAAKVALTLEQTLGADLERLNFSAQALGSGFASATARQQEARRLAGQDRSFNSVLVADAQGQVVAAEPSSLNIKGRTLHSQEALQQRRASISPAFESIAGNLVVFLSQPIWSPDGHYLGLIGGTVHLGQDNSLTQILGTHFQGGESTLYLVDGNRRLLFHPDLLRIGQTLGANPAVDAVLRGEDGAMPSLDGQAGEMLTGYAAVPSAAWGVIVQQPARVADAALKALMAQVLKAIVPMAVLGLLLLWWAAARISAPLRRLADHAERLNNYERVRSVRAWYLEAWRIRRALLIGGQLSQQRIGELDRQAHSDALTGLPNRRSLDDTLQYWVSNGTPFAVVSIDIDHFKRVNDTFGHDVGDQVLRRFGQVLRNCSRHGDMPCRVGGEEFILLLPQTSLAEATDVAERLRVEMENSNLPPIGRLTVSLGVADWTPGQPDVAATLKEADELLYQAKQAGRNRTRVKNPTPSA